jgi:putative ABC transport system permease protein
MKRNKHIQPPGWPLKLLRSIIRNEYLEEIEGDMEEVFRDNLEYYSESKARRLYARDVLLLLRPAVVKRINGICNLTNAAMIGNYLISGWRNFLKYRGYSLINIAGLCTGFVASLLLFLIINYENSFDKFHKNYQQVYRVAIAEPSGDVSDLIVTPQIPLMEEEYPDITHGTRFMDQEDILQFQDRYFRTSFRIVDPGFADMFNFKVVRGDLKVAVSTAGLAVLTEKVATKLFGDQDPIGQTVSLVNEKRQLLVAAVVQNPPANSSLQFEVLIPWQDAPDWFKPDQAGNWYNRFMTGYVQLSPGTTKSEMEKKLAAFVDRHFIEERKSESIVLLPLAGEHFRLTSSRRIIGILGIIAGAILLISCINFMNLTISQLLGRMREIGVRKVMGSRKMQLVYQFMTESMIVCSLALVLGLFVTYLILPIVNNYFGFGIANNFITNRYTFLFVIGICLGTGLISSAWPSIVLSGLNPVSSIKGSVAWNKSGGYFRRALVVVQFGSSIILIIGTTVIWRQIQFMKSQTMNFDGHDVVAIEGYQELFKDPEKAARQILVLKDELLKEPAIEAVASAQAVPGNYWENYNSFEYTDSTGSSTVQMRQLTVDQNFFDTFRMKIVSGRNFSREVESDKQSVIINETAMKKYGWTDINNKRVRSGGGQRTFQVIGVVQDYYYQSLKDDIQPVVHFFNPELTGYLAVRFRPDRVAQGLALLERKWSQLGPYEPFDYVFVDRAFDQLYKEQEKMGTTSSIFSLIAVIIAGLGLFSITAYSIRLRKKEVGIRKVLGASLRSIVMALSSNYGLLILIAFVVACPAAYYLMDVFLEDFAHRIALTPWIFIGAGAFVFIAAMMMVGIQSGRAALENPINALRDE